MKKNVLGGVRRGIVIILERRAVHTLQTSA